MLTNHLGSIALWRCPHRAQTVLDCIASISWKPVLWIISIDTSIIVIHLQHKQYTMTVPFKRNTTYSHHGETLTTFGMLVNDARVVFWLLKKNWRVFGGSLTFYLKKGGGGGGIQRENQVLRYKHGIVRSWWKLSPRRICPSSPGIDLIFLVPF